MRKISVIGSTGSIGTQTLEVVRENKDIEIAALCCGRNINLLEKQIREFKPRLAVTENEKDAARLKESIADLSGIEIMHGMEGLITAATLEEVSVVVTAIVGMIGIEPTIAAINAGKDIALANKETLVTAGHIIMPLAKEKNVKILPVDSEHSAIFQCISGSRKADGTDNEISRLLITASGGPFRGRKREELLDVTVEDALKHPNWSMGHKITIDSATLVNKGLEVIEARHLFNVVPEKIEVVVQPQSIIHSMVEFADGAVMAQLGTPDMKLPIQYALYYPERRFLPGERLDFTKMSGIVIDKPDRETFKGLDEAYRALKEGGAMTTIFNAANEFAVGCFLNKRIKFLQIYDMIEYAMSNVKNIASPDVGEILMKQKETEEVLKKGFDL
ncbi:1-deoxy-D-xylulose 5-phosphate reductoisomerase [Eubacterium ruminantium]|nr:1-deoxy-D-xylulose 5-phosphate reductoisomerase [Eubacterium ruminantium]